MKEKNEISEKLSKLYDEFVEKYSKELPVNSEDHAIVCIRYEEDEGIGSYIHGYGKTLSEMLFLASMENPAIRNMLLITAKIIEGARGVLFNDEEDDDSVRIGTYVHGRFDNLANAIIVACKNNKNLRNLILAVAGFLKQEDREGNPLEDLKAMLNDEELDENALMSIFGIGDNLVN